MNTIYAVRSKGIDPSTGQEIFIKKDGTETFTWDAADQVPCGVAEPTLEGTINTNLRWKGITMNLIFGYRFGIPYSQYFRQYYKRRRSRRNKRIFAEMFTFHVSARSGFRAGHVGAMHNLHESHCRRSHFAHYRAGVDVNGNNRVFGRLFRRIAHRLSIRRHRADGRMFRTDGQIGQIAPESYFGLADAVDCFVRAVGSDRRHSENTSDLFARGRAVRLSYRRVFGFGAVFSRFAAVYGKKRRRHI